MLLYLKIKPNQRFDRIEMIDGEWIVRIKAPAIDGKANEHLINYLSEVLNMAKSKIRLKKGMTSRNKCLDIDADEVFVNDCLVKAFINLHRTM